jgi:hypothetical protein
MHRLYLSRKNLRTLLDKLDRGCVQAAIMKNDVTHRQYPTTVPTLVIALEDDIYYVGRLPLEETPAQPVIEAPAPPTSGLITVGRRKKS